MSSDLETRLLQCGCVALYYNQLLWKQDSAELVSHGWQFQHIYTAQLGNLDEFYDQVASALEFPSYFGRNLNALRDCLRDLVFLKPGCLALGLDCFDVFVRNDRDLAHAVLDVFASMEREFLLNGHRLLLMVQSNDPDLFFPKVGGFDVCWNPEEWLDARRTKPMLPGK
jgi:RNAse (barnase) inhibitor barstar